VKRKKKKSTPIDVSKIGFSVIKQRGSPTEATTLDGVKVYKQEHIVCENPLNPNPEAVKDPIMVKCIDYHGEHFVYLDPVNKKNRWFAWCTCGSPAVIVYGMTAYSGMTDSMALICFFRGKFGRNVSDVTNKRAPV